MPGTISFHSEYWDLVLKNPTYTHKTLNLSVATFSLLYLNELMLYTEDFQNYSLSSASTWAILKSVQGGEVTRVTEIKSMVGMWTCSCSSWQTCWATTNANEMAYINLVTVLLSTTFYSFFFNKHNSKNNKVPFNRFLLIKGVVNQDSAI